MSLCNRWSSVVLSAAILLTGQQALAEGDLTLRPVKLPNLVLGTEDNRYYLSQTRYELVTGKSYKLKIIASGQTEYAIRAPGFFQSIFLRKVEAGGMEIKATSLTELEFEQEGTAEIFFVPVKTGEFEFYSAGFEEKGMKGVFSVK